MDPEKDKQEEIIQDEEQLETTETENTTEEVEEKEEQEDEVTQLKNKILELEDQHLRLTADFDNIRKRMEKEKFMAIAYAHETFARDLLPIIDALEMAKNSSDVDENQNSDELLNKIKEGIDLTIEQFKKTFEKHGVELVNMSGEFDPNFHEAVMQLESEEKKSGEILEVFQKGYKIKDRVLRPAMVSIAK